MHSADMVVRSIGNSLMVILPELLGKKITAWFDLVRPLIAFKFQTVSLTHSYTQIYVYIRTLPYMFTPPLHYTSHIHAA